MDRLLVAELPPLLANADGTGGWTEATPSYYRNPNYSGPPLPGIFIVDQVIDLSGYQQQDMTAFFRRSFEQRGVVSSIKWYATPMSPLKSFDISVFEHVLVTTSPLTDTNLLSCLLAAPGFININAIFEQPTINRDQVIHARTYLHGLDTAIGSDSLTDQGAGYTRIVQEYDYSSLEPTAVDKLYVYRMFTLSDSAVDSEDTGLYQAFFGPARILLDTLFDKEAEIPYFMRLKRGYELANQV